MEFEASESVSLSRWSRSGSEVFCGVCEREGPLISRPGGASTPFSIWASCLVGGVLSLEICSAVVSSPVTIVNEGVTEVSESMVLCEVLMIRYLDPFGVDLIFGVCFGCFGSVVFVLLGACCCVGWLICDAVL